MSAAIVSPRLLSRMDGFFPALATIQETPEIPALDDFGQEVEVWTDVIAWQNIPCAKAPPTGIIGAMERQAAGYTATDQVWHVLLKGAYPAITTRHRLTIDADIFDIDAVETDQTTSLTRLRVRQITI